LVSATNIYHNFSKFSCKEIFLIKKNKYKFAPQITLKTYNKTMKKVLTLVVLAAAIYACGPSAEEKAAAEKAKQDSIAAVEAAAQAKAQAEADSIAKAEEAAKAAAQADSMAKAEEAAKGKKK
jgi:hypothetical protein